jgi:hypothetical protein
MGAFDTAQTTCTNDENQCMADANTVWWQCMGWIGILRPFAKPACDSDYNATINSCVGVYTACIAGPSKALNQCLCALAKWNQAHGIPPVPADLERCNM